ncbi:MAG TPA: hypothetical protein VKC60_06700 [Opitutaceae bacterium]|nr:hypothetical protein [Opitutaceae bacterium]
MNKSIPSSRLWFTAALAAVFFATAALGFGQAPAPTPTTRVLASLSVKADIPRDQVMKVLPDEVRDTVKLYLAGKIDQWYSRSDGKGVVFIMNCQTVEEAKALIEELPLAKANFAELTYVPLGPLSPLRVLVGSPPPASVRSGP